MRNSLDEALGVSQSDFSSSSIGPTFGEQIARTAIIAVIASLILISIYIGLRFEFKYSVPVLIALFHDILITAGVYALADREVTTSTVAALLTILGYSLYDTIIVFDRIRENVPRMPRAAFTQIVNRSMAEVLTRSLATSLCTLLPVTALMLFGGETLQRLRVRAARRNRIGCVLVDLHRVACAGRVEGARAGLPPPPQAVMEEHGGLVPAFATGAIADQEPATVPRPPRRASVRSGGASASSRGRRRNGDRDRAAEPPEPRAGATGGRASRSRLRLRRRPSRPTPADGADGAGDRPPPPPKPKRSANARSTGGASR